MEHIMQWPTQLQVQNTVPRNGYFVTIFSICGIMGMFPYRLRNGIFAISVPYCILSTAGMCLVLGYTLYVVFELFYSFVDHALVESISMEPVRLGFYISLTLLYSVSLGTSFSRAPSVNEILLALDDIDRLLSTTHFCVLHHIPIKFSVKEFLCGVLTVLLFVYAPWANSIEFHTYRVYIFWLSSSVWLSCAQFSILGRLVQSRASEVCDSLNDIRLFVHCSIRTRRITLLSDLHSKLCDTCAVLETSYSKLLTVLVTVCFFGITICSFFIVSDPYLHVQCYSEVLSPGSDFQDSIPMIRILTVLLGFLCVWEIVECSSKISEKIQEFHVIVYEIMVCDKSKDLLRNATNEIIAIQPKPWGFRIGLVDRETPQYLTILALREFRLSFEENILAFEKLKLHICMKREVALTACGLFPLDYTLIHSMVAAVTSYMVILIQFQQSDHSTGGNTTMLYTATDTSFTTTA